MQFRLSPAFYRLAACALVLVACVRIVSTYHVFNQVIDEPFHIAAGMEWLDKGTYTYDTEDPVLSRVAVAVGPYLVGERSMGQPERLREGNAILYGRGHYYRTLSLARAGVLPFFVLACAVLWLWCQKLYGDERALAAVFLFTTLPPVLAHAGLATTDVTGCACMLAALYAFTRWMEEPGMRQGLVLGLCTGLALLAKFTALLFLPLCFLTIVILYVIAERSAPAQWRRRASTLASAVAVALLLVWAGYRFSFGPLPEHAYFAAQPPVTIDRYIGGHSVPAPEYFNGIAEVQLHNFGGHPAWCLGKYSDFGWWYYFPVVLLLKTTLAFLLLAAAGYGFALVRSRREGFAWKPWVPGACAVVILASVMPAHINIGVRHILLMYPLLAMMGGLAAVSLWRKRKPAALAASCALLIWQGFASIHAHPDYLAYMNELAHGDRAYYLSDSDLDWGQDLQRLSDKLKEVGANKVTLAYFGDALESRIGLPEVQIPTAYQPATGWVAVSAYARTIIAARVERREKRTDSPFAWLAAYRPVAHIGQSIDLYYIPPK
jgi:4-amino-4-deoxy-L-arabinose transferase-like glycosyltransferase